MNILTGLIEAFLNVFELPLLMKALEHIRLAVFSGIVVGILHGLVDITAKFAVWSFEWFELYQTLLLSILVFTFVFSLLGIFFEITVKLSKLKLTKKACYRFYFVTSIALLVLFYAATIVNRDILSKLTFWDIKSLTINFFIFAATGLVYLFLLFKGKDYVDGIVSFFNKAKIKKILKNYIFAVFVFIIVSFAIDLYMLNNIPSSADRGTGNKPNIILISLDSVRADHLSMYGYEPQTSPNLDKLSEDSIVFKNAISPNIWTILVHGGIFTGNYISTFDPEHSNSGLEQEDKTFVEFLRNNGYNTAGFISSAWIKSKYGFGQGFNIYKDRMDFLEHELTYDKFSMKGAIFTFVPGIKKIMDIDTFRSSEEINKEAIEWLKKNKDSNFFLFLHYIGPHVPYNPSEEFRKKFTEDARSYDELERAYKKSTGLKRYGDVSQDVVDALIKLYDAKIAELDYNINIFLEGVKELGLKDNTIIIITSDSGEEFYDHGYFKHSRTLYQELVHVPLLIYYPEKLEPKTVEEPVSTIDIFPTVFDILGIGIPERIDGASLMPLIKNYRSYEREFIKSELFGLPGHETKQQTAIFHNEWKLLEVEPETEAIPSGLYNLRTDPKEKKNLYNVFPERRESLKKYIPNSSD